MKHNNLKVYLKKVIIMISAIALSAFVIALNFTQDSGFSRHTKAFDSDLAYIKSSALDVNADSISMTEAQTSKPTNPNGVTITIKDEEELVIFSNKCNSDDDYLSYRYKLISNIKWSTSSFKPIAYKSGKAFTGVFDGQGYEISYLDFNPLKDEDVTYFAMFAKNNGTIKDLGLIRPNIAIPDTSKFDKNCGVSYLVGENNGSVTGCFVIDDGIVNPLNLKDGDDLAGITAPGCRISDLCVDNKGTLINNYVVTSIVTNFQLNDFTDFAEIALNNTASDDKFNRNFYLNTSIQTYGSDKITYTEGYNLNAKPVSKVYGDYCIDKTALINSLITDSSHYGWFKADDYGTYSSNTKIKYAVRRGVAYKNSTSTFTIDDEKAFAYMFELFNVDDIFASNKVTYEITNNLNLDLIAPASYTYNKGIGAKIVGVQLNNKITTMVDNSQSNYPTIYNADILNRDRIAKNAGVECFGLFNFVTGNISNLNIYAGKAQKDNANNVTIGDLDLSNTYSNTYIANNKIKVKGIGILAGYIEKGTVDNVNVYGNFVNGDSKTNATNIGEYYLGGICGVLGGAGVITNCTSAGSFDIKEASGDIDYSDAYLKGIAVGGIVGYIEESSGALVNCVNAININIELGQSVDYSIGGIVGAGYTTNYNHDVIVDDELLSQSDKTSNLENLGNINVGNTNGSLYKSLYVAGIIGRHLGVTAQVTRFNNIGKITVYANSNDTFVSGVENANIQKSTTNGTGLRASKYIDKNGEYIFYASTFTNRADVNVFGGNLKAKVSNVLLINSPSVISQLEGLFNLGYYSKYADDVSAGGDKTDYAYADVQTINLNSVTSFAGVLNVTAGESTNASMLYNLRDINFETTADISSKTNYLISGVSLGNNISYSDIRNEGKLNFNLNNGISTNSTLKISGLFDTLSNECLANKLYNGGDIIVSDGASSDINLSIYLSGICLQNLSIDSSDSQNPTKLTFDESKVGTLDEAINNGKLKVTSSDYDHAMTITKSKNDNTPENASQTSSTNLNGDVFIGGISYLNEGIISNAFNLGDIQLDAFARNNNSKFYAGGIACDFAGPNAQIRDSANNGTIQVIDMCNSVNSEVYAGGLVANNINTKLDNSISKNLNEVIAFSINYGTIVGVNGSSNVKVTGTQSNHCFVGGIIARGTCNVINILNYGNIYGSEVVGSIIGAFNLGLYDDIEFSIANTINYSNVKILEKYHYDGGTLSHMIFKDFDIIDYNDNDNDGYEALKYVSDGAYSADRAEYYYLGSMFGFINFAIRTKGKIKIRYVINFYNGAYITQNNLQYNIPEGNVDTSTFITVNGSVDTFGGGSVAYAPLSSVRDNAGNIGVFSDDFIFRRAINGDASAIDSSIVTDAYIADFFQFVRFDKVNEVLIEKIGWKNLAYLDAAEALARNVKAMSVFVNNDNLKYNSENEDNVVNVAFTSESWYSNIDEDLFDNLMNEIIAEDTINTSDLTDSNLTAILQYILFDNKCYSSISSSIRESIINKIFKYYDDSNTTQSATYYSDILQTLLYDELLAKVVSGESTDYVSVQNKIRTLINTNSKSSELKTVLENYLTALINSGDILNPLFPEEDDNDGDNYAYEDYYLIKKMELIQTLLTGYSSATLSQMLDEIVGDNTTAGAKLKFVNYLNSNSSEALDIYAKLITQNSLSESSNYRNVINKALKKYDSVSVVKTIDTSNIIDKFDSVEAGSYSWINGKKWYYTKDYSSLWNIVKNNSDFQTYLLGNTNNTNNSKYFNENTDPTSSIKTNSIIAKATEWNNTYQSNDGPSKIYEGDETTTFIKKCSYSATDAGKTKDYSFSVDPGENIPSADGYNANNGGIFRNKNEDNNDDPIRNRFIFTPDEVNSYATYYYGPYMANGKLFSSKFKNPNILGYELYNSSSSAAKTIVPVFISTNRTITENAIKNSNTSSTNTTISRFYWNNYNKESSRYQWVSDYIIDTNKGKGDGTNYLLKDYRTSNYNENNLWIVDDYNFAPEAIHTQKYEKTTKNGDLKYSDIIGSDTTDLTLSLTKYESSHKYRSAYLSGYATSAIYTGVYFVHSVWYEGGIVGTFLMAKETGGKDRPLADNFAGYNGVNTTQYIAYELSDLLELNGKQTKGRRDGRADADEIGIISAIMEDILSTDAGKKAVLKALAEYAQTKSFDASDSTSALYLASALRGTTFASQATAGVIALQSEAALKSEFYNYDEVDESNNITLYEKLLDLTASTPVTLDMAGATDKEIFRKILLATLNNEKYDNDVGTTTITSKDITFFIYNYVNYLREQNPSKSESEIINLFTTNMATITSSDLDKFTTLSTISFTDFIDVVGGTAVEGQGGGIGFGGSLNVAEMFYRMMYIADSGNSAWASTVTSDSTGKHGSYPNEGYALPLVVNNEISPSAYATLGSGTPVANNYEVVASNNIGYMTGSDNSAKITGKKISTAINSSYLTKVGNKYTDFKIYSSTSSTSGDSYEYTGLDDNIKEAVLDMLNDDSGNMYAIRLSAQVSHNQPISMSSITVAGKTYPSDSNNSSISYLPSSAVWFVPQQDGVVKLVISTQDGAANGFSIYTIQRGTPTDSSNPYSGSITSTSVIDTVYRDSNGDIYYKYENDNNFDSTGLTKVYSKDYPRSLNEKALYYFEIPVKVGYEYALGNQNGAGPFLMYLDLGQNGGSSTITKYPDLSTVESNYNTNYGTLSAYGNYLATNLVSSEQFSPKTNSKTISVLEPTIALVKADNGGTITVSGDTTYEYEGNDITINSISKASNGGYRAFYLSGGEYTISTGSDDIISEILTVKYNSGISYDANGSSIYYDDDTTDPTTKKLIFTGTDYDNLASFNLDIDLTSEILETLLVVYPSIKTDSSFDFFKNTNLFTDAELREIAILLAKADNETISSAFGRLLSNLNSSYYDDLLLSITDTTVRKNILRKIIEIVEADTSNHSDSEDLIIAGYLGQDYLNKSSTKQLTNTILHSLLEDYDAEGEEYGAGDYQFITGDSSIDATKFNAFLKHLGESANLNGYGIFALASSHGIQNGTFIPDNLDLEDLDVYYETDSNLGVLTLFDSKDSGGHDVPSSAEWRGGKNISAGDAGTVDFAFYHDMKQLKKAISTTIFELDLKSSDYIIYASSSTVDVNHGTITYFVPDIYFNTFKASQAASIEKIEKAETASFVTNNDNETTIDLTGGTLNANQTEYTKLNAITVIAEDTTVKTNYSIILKKINVLFNVTSNVSDLEPTGGDVKLTITSDNIPDSFDFKPFFEIYNGQSYRASDNDPKWTFDASTRNNGIVSNGTATMVINVLSSLPGGNEIFKITALGEEESVTIEKALNTEAEIEVIKYQGQTLTINNGAYTSDIKFGRAFNYDELVSYNDKELFYLSELKVSDNATLEVSATKAPVDDNKPNGRIKYTVTFTVTSEDTLTVNYFSHILTEKTYFENNSIFAEVYADGDPVSMIDGWDGKSPSQKTAAWEDLNELERIYALSGGSLKYVANNDKFGTTNTTGTNSPLGDNVKIEISYNRADDREPQYRVKYNLSNFYTLGNYKTEPYDNSEDTIVVSGAKVNKGAIQDTYAGLTATVSNIEDTGTYIFIATYKNSGIWEDNEAYDRYYEFPELVIKKLASTDALLKKITFLEEAISLGNTATVIRHDKIVMPDGNASGSNEISYSDAFNGIDRAISVSSTTINYNDASKATSVSDYYVIGTVSNADLSYYCPTFGIDKYAQMYQYTTNLKLTGYGSGKQTLSDIEILGNHNDDNTMYLYVPFVHNNEKEVFLVELDSDGYWTTVYRTDFDGTNADETNEKGKPITVGNFPTSGDSRVKAKNAKGMSISDGTTTYTVMDSAGEPVDNMSLFMDYVGTPLDGHFWYISYVIFSEDYLEGSRLEGNIRYYHTSIIDLTNNIQFYVKVYAPSDFDKQDLYLTLSENIYDNGSMTSRQISGYVELSKTETYTSTYKYNGVILSNYKVYNLSYNLQSLPVGYFYFYLDLPAGYIAEAYTDKDNQLTDSDPNYDKDKDKTPFLPYSSIITQKVNLEIVIKKGTGENSGAWAVSTSSVYTRDAEYIGTIPTSNEDDD